METQAYLTLLIERQMREGWSDRQMARELRIAHTSWYRVRIGERGIGTRVLRAMMARFPEYNAHAFFFLSQNASDGGNPVAGCDARPAA